MSRVFNKYVTSFQHELDFAKYLADSSFTSSATEEGMTANQYHAKYKNYTVMKSDGSKRCGFYVDLTNKMIHGDFVETSIEMNHISGAKPFVVYEEWEGVNSTQFGKKALEVTNGFSELYVKQYVPNRYGTYKGRVFVGLDIGQVGTFAFRFPTVTHHAQIKYSSEHIVSSDKVFQFTKSGGAWKVEATTGFRKLDAATFTISGNALWVNYSTPFIVDVPQIFFTTNTHFAGTVAYFGYRTTETVEIRLFNADGTVKNWNDIPDNATINILAKGGLMY